MLIISGGFLMNVGADIYKAKQQHARDAREPPVALEMSSANNSSSEADQENPVENPIISAAMVKTDTDEETTRL